MVDTRWNAAFLGGPLHGRTKPIPVKVERFRYGRDLYYVPAPFRYSWWAGPEQYRIEVVRWIPESEAPSTYEDHVLVDLCLAIFAALFIDLYLHS